jgi:FeS assembly SUF system protein
MDENNSATETKAGEEAAPACDRKPLDGLEMIALQDKVIEALRTCYDPEIPVNIYELGLIYEAKVEASGEVNVRMTLTSPNCPAAASLPVEVREKVKALPSVTDAKVEVVFDPPWDPSKMTEAARLQLGMF